MLDLAYGFSRAGDQQRFEDALQRSRVALDRLADLAFTNSYIDFVDSVYWAMMGDHGKALARLANSVDTGYLSGTRLSEGWGALNVLQGDPEYEAIQQRMFDHLNEERDELGLESMVI